MNNDISVLNNVIGEGLRAPIPLTASLLVLLLLTLGWQI